MLLASYLVPMLFKWFSLSSSAKNSTMLDVRCSAESRRWSSAPPSTAAVTYQRFPTTSETMKEGNDSMPDKPCNFFWKIGSTSGWVQTQVIILHFDCSSSHFWNSPALFGTLSYCFRCNKYVVYSEIELVKFVGAEQCMTIAQRFRLSLS